MSAGNQIPFLATGGGHGNSLTMSRLQDGLVIDLGNFNAFSLDAENNLLTVGGSTIYNDVLQTLYDAGKQLRMYLSVKSRVSAPRAKRFTHSHA